MDEKSDSFSYRMKTLGTLTYGDTSASKAYTKTPRYRAFKFGLRLRCHNAAGSSGKCFA